MEELRSLAPYTHLAMPKIPALLRTEASQFTQLPDRVHASVVKQFMKW
jgi:hypothetical protein